MRNETISGRPHLMKVIYIIIWCISLTALVLTYTRGAWCALAISTAVMAIAGRKMFFKGFRRESAAMALLFLLLMSGIMTVQYLKGGNTLIKRIVSLADMSAIQMDRVFLWNIGIHNFADHMLIGTGPGTFPYIFPRYRFLEPCENRLRAAMPESCHNEIIETASSMGIAGLLSSAAVILCFFYIIMLMLRSSEHCLAGICMAASGTAYLVHTALLFPTLSSELLWWFLLSAAAMYMNRQPAERDEVRSLSWPARVLIAGLSLLSVMLMYGSARHAMGDYHMAAAQRYESAGKWMDALLSYEKAIEAEPLQPRYFLLKGKMLERIYCASGIKILPEEIIRSYRAAIELNPMDPYPWADLGRFATYYAQNGRPAMMKVAEESYTRALSLDSYNPLFCNDFGSFYSQVGKYQKAKNYYIRGLSLSPESTMILTNLAMLSWAMDDAEEARGYLQRVLRVDPCNEKARLLLKRIKTP